MGLVSAQYHVEQAILSGDGLGLLPKPVAGIGAGRVVVDGKGEGIVPIGDGVAGCGVEEKTLVVQ